jgi:hypothetical protein
MEPVRNEQNDSKWLCPKSEIDRRMSICKKCDQFCSFQRCAHCGCLMTLKAMLLESECPEGKWKAH